jgi:hypothetical protein
VLTEIEIGETEFASVQLRFGILAEYVESSRIHWGRLLPLGAGFVRSKRVKAQGQSFSQSQKYSVFTLQKNSPQLNQCPHMKMEMETVPMAGQVCERAENDNN